MCKVKNIYVKNGQINFTGEGRLASIDDLNQDLGLYGVPLEDCILQVQEGTFKWQTKEQVEKIFKNDDEITEEELNEIENEYIGEYIEYPVQTLCNELVNDIDDEWIEKLVDVRISNDELLIAMTESVHNNWMYVYNYSRDKEDNNKIIKVKTMFHKSMLDAA